MNLNSHRCQTHTGGPPVLLGVTRARVEPCTSEHLPSENNLQKPGSCSQKPQVGLLRHMKTAWNLRVPQNTSQMQPDQCSGHVQDVMWDPLNIHRFWLSAGALEIDPLCIPRSHLYYQNSVPGYFPQ